MTALDKVLALAKDYERVEHGKEEHVSGYHSLHNALGLDSLRAVESLHKNELFRHMTELHAGVKTGGRRIGPKNPTFAQLVSDHAAQHAQRTDLGHVHEAAVSMTSGLGKVFALAQGGTPDFTDVSEPTTPDTTQGIDLLQVDDDHPSYIQSQKAVLEQSALTPLNRIKISSYLDGAKQAQGAGDSSLCTSMLARAYNACKTAGKHHMAADIRQHLRSVSMEGNKTSDPDDADVMSAGDKSVAEQSDNPTQDRGTGRVALGRVLRSAGGEGQPFRAS